MPRLVYRRQHLQDFLGIFISPKPIFDVLLDVVNGFEAGSGSETSQDCVGHDGIRTIGAIEEISVPDAVAPLKKRFSARRVDLHVNHQHRKVSCSPQADFPFRLPGLR